MKRSAYLTHVTLAGAVLLAACDGNASGAASYVSPAKQLAQLEYEGKLPKLDRSASVAGADADGNGVRDDIDLYLRQRFADTAQLAAATQMARAMQSAVMAGGRNPDAGADADRRIMNGINCLHDRLADSTGINHPSAVVREIEAITSNTKARTRAYLAYNNSRDGTVSMLPDGDTCE